MKALYIRRLWILSVVTGVLFGAKAFAGPNGLNSNSIPTEFQAHYGFTPNCGDCHGKKLSVRPNDMDGDGTEYGRALDAAMDFKLYKPSNVPLNLTVGDSIPNAEIQSKGFKNVEAEFAPHVASFNGLAENSGKIILPGTQNFIGVIFDSGKNFLGAIDTLQALNPSGELASFVPDIVNTSLTIQISGIESKARGARRRSNQPYTLAFDPVNTQGFRNFEEDNKPRNQFEITFSNIPPMGNSESASATIANTSANKLPIPVLSNDNDPDGPEGDMTVELVSDLSGNNPGTLEINSAGDGFLYAVPAQLPTAPDATTSFSYRPVDGEGLRGDPVTVTVFIPQGQNPPNAQDDVFSFDEDEPLSGDVKRDNGNGPDSDPEGLETVTFELTKAPARGQLDFSSDGTFTYVPFQDDFGQLTFEYRIRDLLSSDTGRVTLNIVPQNDPPIAQSDSFVAKSNNGSANKLELLVLNNDRDPDHQNNELTVSLVSGLTGSNPGTLEMNSDRTGFLYVIPDMLPAASQLTSFEYAPVDGANQSGAAATVQIVIPSPAATPPVAQDDMFTFSEDTILSGDLKADNGNGPDVDQDGLDTVVYSVLNAPQRGHLELSTDGRFTYEPQLDDFGTLVFDYEVSDGTTSDSGLVELTIVPINDAPVGSSDSFFAQVQNTEENKLELNVLENDTDADHLLGDLKVNLKSGLKDATQGGLEINRDATGFLYWVPETLPESATEVTFTYAPVDANGLEGGHVLVTVGIPERPLDTSLKARGDFFSMVEDTVFSGDVKLDNGSGADTNDTGFDRVEYSVLTPPPEASGTLDMDAGGLFTFVPAQDVNGTVTFQYLVRNGSVTDFATVEFDISPKNDAPVATIGELSRRTENEAAFEIDLLAPVFATDVDGDLLNVNDVEISVALNETDSVPVTFEESELYRIEGSVVLVKPTVLRELDDDEAAVIEISYKIDDGLAEPVENTVTQQILGIDNGLGRLAGLYADSISSRYNGHFGGLSEASGSCHTCHLPGRVDADVDSVDECVQSPPVFNNYGLKLCLNRDAKTPALADLARRMKEAEAEFAPRLSPAVGLTVQETAAPGDLIGFPLTPSSTGKTVDGGIANIIDYLIVADGAISKTDASGQFTVDATGQLRVADGAQLVPGLHSFVVLPVNDAGQKDNSGAIIRGRPGFYPFEEANQTTFSINVGAILPVAAADIITTLQDTPITFDVTENDTAGSASSVMISAAPEQGTAVVNADLSVTYTPDSGYVGTDTFVYVAANQQGLSEPGTVTITVLENGSVIARDDVVNTLSGASVLIDVLANDFGVQRGGTNQTVVELFSTPDASTVGSVQVDGQSIEFTPIESFFGQTTLTYSATNPGGRSTQAKVNITVLARGGTLISDVIENPELKKVAVGFEQSCETASEAEFLRACSNITAAALNSEDLVPIMKALRNEEHFAAVDTAQSVARGFGRGLNRRIRNMRSKGARGFDFSGLNISVNNKALPPELLDSVTSGILGLGQTDPELPIDWNLFLSGDISVNNKSSSASASGFETTATNMMVGLEYTISDQRDIGFALGYTNSDADFSNGGGLKSRTVQGSIYGRMDDVLRDGVNFDGYLSFGRMKFDSDRRIVYTANGTQVDTVASAAFDGSYLNVSPSISISEKLGRYGDRLGELKTGVNLEWRLGLDYLRLLIDGYSETGGAGLALTTHSETYDSLQVFAGVSAHRPIWIAPEIQTELRGGLTLYGELLDKSRTVSSSFRAAGAGAPRFIVTEDGNSGLGGTIELGMSIAYAPNTIDLDYSFDRSASGVRSHNLALEYRRQLGRRAAVSAGIRRDLGGSGIGNFSGQIEYNLKF